MCVIPEKSNRRTYNGAAKDSELTDLRHALQFEVGCKSGVATEVGENRKRSGSDHGTADGEPVQSVRKIHGVARSDNHKHNEGHERQEGQRPELGMNRPSLNHQVRVELLEEGNDQRGGVFSAVLQDDHRNRNQNAGPDLKAQLGACGKAEIAAMNDLEVVVGKTNRTKRQRGKDRNPDEWIAQVCPQQCRHQNGDGDQQPTHRRRARFFLMSLRTFFADVLPDLEIAQTTNHDGPNDEPGEERGKAGEGGPESQVTKNTEGRKIMEELQVEQPVEQSASDTSCQLSAVSSQVPAPRRRG